jgi:hypothetical protein
MSRGSVARVVDAQLQVRIGPIEDLGREHALIRAAPLQREASADLDGDLAIRDGISVFQPQGAALIEVRVVSVDEETVVQLNNIGPWVITYIDPKDDPRQIGRP